MKKLWTIWKKQTNKKKKKNTREAIALLCILYSLNVKEWKVHSLSEWKQFHFYRVNFHSEKSEILLCHSLKSDISLFKEWNFHSFRVNFSLFLRIDHSSHSCERTNLNFNKHKRNHLYKEWLEWSIPKKEWKIHSKRLCHSLKSDIVRFHSFQSGNSFYKSEISLF